MNIPRYEDTEPIIPKYEETEPVEQKSIAGFGKNVWEDIKGTAKGLGALGEGLLTQPVETVVSTAKALPGALVEEGKRIGIGKLITGHPIKAAEQFGEAMYEKPLTTTLDVLPAAGAAGKALGFGGKAARGAKLAAEAGKATELAKGAELAAEVSPMAKAAEFVSKKYAKQPMSLETKGFYDALDPKYKSALDAIENELEGQPITKNLKQSGGEYLPGVKAEHEAIVSEIVNKPSAAALPGQKPKAVFVFGLPATGKSSLIKKGFPGIPEYKNIVNDHILLDADDLMPKLKGYEPRKAPLFHDEAGDILDQAIKKATDQGMNIVVPAIGKTGEKYQTLFSMLKEHGYDVDMVHVKSMPKQAAFNSTTRFSEGGRYVAPSYVIDDVGLKTDALYDKLKPEVSNHAQYRSEATRGQSPVLVENVRSGGNRGGRSPEGSEALPGREAGGGKAPQPATAPGVTPPTEAPAAPWAKTQEAISALKSKIPPEIVTPFQKAGEWAKTKYAQAAEKPGLGETFGKYFKQHARNMAMKATGAAPGQIRKIGLKQAEKLADYLLDKKLVSSGMGDIGRAEKIMKLNQEAGQMVGDIRSLATTRGAAHNMPALIDEIKNKVLPQYSAGVKSGEASQVAKALEEIQMSGATPDKVAKTITNLFQESKKMDRLKQPSGAYADVARELRRANEDLMTKYLKPEEIKAYHNALEEYGATTQIKEFIKRKESMEMGGRLGPGSGISRMMVQKAFDTVGYRTEAQIANRMARWFKENPKLPASPKDIFRKYIDEAAEAVDEMINPLE